MATDHQTDRLVRNILDSGRLHGHRFVKQYFVNVFLSCAGNSNTRGDKSIRFLDAVLNVVLISLQISLYKFVRHAGDLLPPSLYIPYIHMLTGLANGPQSSHHCFNLLKTNGKLFSMSILILFNNARRMQQNREDGEIECDVYQMGITRRN